jgi:hypothetical protein
MNNSFDSYLVSVIDKIQRIIENLDSTYYRNLEFLKKNYLTARDKLDSYLESVGEIISSFKKQNPNFFYPKIEEIKEMDTEEIELEKRKWDFAEPKFKEIVDNPFKVEDIKVFSSWEPREVDKCSHHERDVVVTFCKKAHCKICLKSEIEKNNSRCNCGIELSPKNVHEIMGFQFRLDRLFQLKT